MWMLIVWLKALNVNDGGFFGGGFRINGAWVDPKKDIHTLRGETLRDNESSVKNTKQDC